MGRRRPTEETERFERRVFYRENEEGFLVLEALCQYYGISSQNDLMRMLIRKEARAVGVFPQKQNDSEN